MLLKYLAFIIASAGIIFYIFFGQAVFSAPALTAPETENTLQNAPQENREILASPAIKQEGIFPVENLLQQTNLVRNQKDLPSLQPNQLLSEAAQIKAEDMAKREYFSHQTPEGKMSWEFISQAGYDYKTAGENLGVNYKNPEELVENWMNSPKHRQNILDEGFTEIGIGVAEGNYKGEKALFVVELYASPDEGEFFALQWAY